RLAQHVVVSNIPDQGWERGLGYPRGVKVDYDHVAALPGQVAADGAADPAPPADDRVPGHPADVAFHPAPFDVTAQMTFHQRLEHDAERVQRGTGPGQDQPDREDLPGCVERVDLAETDGSDCRDRLVDRVECAEPQDRVADAAGDNHPEHHG